MLNVHYQFQSFAACENQGGQVLHQSNGFYPAGSQVPTSDWLYPAAIENSY
jgi:hypothetical protein